MVSSKKKWTVMNPIRRQMKKRNPSSGQNGQLVHWWLLIHSGPSIVAHNVTPTSLTLAVLTNQFLKQMNFNERRECYKGEMQNGGTNP
jgi:hypothetical protein